MRGSCWRWLTPSAKTMPFGATGRYPALPAAAQSYQHCQVALRRVVLGLHVREEINPLGDASGRTQAHDQRVTLEGCTGGLKREGSSRALKLCRHGFVEVTELVRPDDSWFKADAVSVEA